MDEAEERWEDTEAEGRLHVGVDVGRVGDDDSEIAPRRGQKILELQTRNGLDEQRLANEVIQVVRQHRSPREQKAAVKVDACGGIGLHIVGHLLAYQDEIEVIPVNVSEHSRLPSEYPLLRDQLWFGVRCLRRERAPHARKTHVREKRAHHRKHGKAIVEALGSRMGRRGRAPWTSTSPQRSSRSSA